MNLFGKSVPVIVFLNHQKFTWYRQGRKRWVIADFDGRIVGSVSKDYCVWTHSHESFAKYIRAEDAKLALEYRLSLQEVSYNMAREHVPPSALRILLAGGEAAVRLAVKMVQDDRKQQSKVAWQQENRMEYP